MHEGGGGGDGAVTAAIVFARLPLSSHSPSFLAFSLPPSPLRSLIIICLLLVAAPASASAAAAAAQEMIFLAAWIPMPPPPPPRPTRQPTESSSFLPCGAGLPPHASQCW